jgi:mono/diheme cytochrome c family protein
MGKTGRLGPAENVPVESGIRETRFVDKQSVTLGGADFYRLNCRGCHGESGLGAPPEINSVIDPVRSSSAALVMERMKRVGMDMNPAEAAQLAKQSQNALLLRLHNGGQDMPPFLHLNDEEIRALMAYLRELANVPGTASRQFTAHETPERIGEHIVKSTCHTCHSATGVNPNPQQLADGAIPPLSALTSRVNEAQFIRKVTRGATIEMGAPALAYRGRMPVFYYLSEEEAADAYLYLTRYAPGQYAMPEPAIAVLSDADGRSDADSRRMQNDSFKEKPALPKESKKSDAPGMRPITVAVLAGALVSLLLVGMAVVTVREWMRLALEADKAEEHKIRQRVATPFVARLESERIA